MLVSHENPQMALLPPQPINNEQPTRGYRLTRGFQEIVCPLAVFHRVLATSLSGMIAMGAGYGFTSYAIHSQSEDNPSLIKFKLSLLAVAGIFFAMLGSILMSASCRQILAEINERDRTARRNNLTLIA